MYTLDEDVFNEIDGLLGKEWFNQYLSNEIHQEDQVLSRSPEYEVNDNEQNNLVTINQPESLNSAVSDNVPNQSKPSDIIPTSLKDKIETSYSFKVKKQVYQKPQIPPHVEIKESTEKKKNKCPSSEKRNRNEKDGKPTNKNKRIKKSDEHCKSKEIHSKEGNENVQVARKRKLKEIAAKCLEEKAAKTTNCRTADAPVRVKVSNTRGNFLTEDCSMPSTSKGITSHAAAQKTINNINTSQIHLPRSCYGIEDILFSMLSWKTIWFKEFKCENGLPPIMQQEHLQTMLQRFNSCEQYYKIVKPFFEIELFNSIYKAITTTSDPRIAKQVVQIDNEIHKSSYIELHCSCYINVEQIDNGYHAKLEDVITIDLYLRQNDQNVSVALMGYVTDVKTIGGLEQNVALSDGKLSLTIMVERYSGHAVKEIFATVGNVLSLTSFKRMVKSVKYLEHSPLCWHVLKPTIELYRVRNVKHTMIHLQDKLNRSQYKAVKEATDICLREEPGIYLIEGPPGTGKSTVIMNILQQILFSKKQSSRRPCILVTAPSNAAVDEIVLRLIKLRQVLEKEQRKLIKLIRIGPKSMIHPDVEDYYIEEIIRRNVVIEARNRGRSERNNEILELDKYIRKLKDSNFSETTQELIRIKKRSKKVIDQNEYKTMEKNIIVNATVICSTLSSCAGETMLDIFQKSSVHKITCCLVDEATKCSEQETLIPLSLNIDKLVLVGDPKQSPAVTLSKEVKDHGHGESLFSRIMSNIEESVIFPITMLDVQY